MASFFEKLKKGMGIDESEGIEEEVEETEETEEVLTSAASPEDKQITDQKPARKKRITRSRKITIGESADSSPISLKRKSAVAEPEDSPVASSNLAQHKITPEEELEEIKTKEEKPPLTSAAAEDLTVSKDSETKEEWFEPEGELAIDVYQTEDELVIQSAIAGIKPEDLDISMERDIIAIKGSRKKPFEEEGDYFTQECYWGPFSREIILPTEVDPERIEAVMKDGILTIRIPKILREKLRKIKVRI